MSRRLNPALGTRAIIHDPDAYPEPIGPIGSPLPLRGRGRPRCQHFTTLDCIAPAHVVRYDCARPAGHTGRHRDARGTTWGDDPVRATLVEDLLQEGLRLAAAGPELERAARLLGEAARVIERLAPPEPGARRRG